MILQRRFGNYQQIIAKHMEQLLNLTPVTSANNLAGLRHLFDFVETHIRSLKSLGVAADSDGSLLSSVLLNKLPTEVPLLIRRKVPEADWSLDALLKDLQEELQAREEVALDRSMSNTTSGKRGRQSPHTAAALVASAGTGTPVCCYCHQAHQSRDCRVVTQPEARRQILRKFGHCYMCLCSSHISRQCRLKGRCSKCNRRHHTSICMGKSSNTTRKFREWTPARSNRVIPIQWIRVRSQRQVPQGLMWMLLHFILRTPHPST